MGQRPDQGSQNVSPLRESMVDVQSPQQALRAYSNAKEYACGILCDARHGKSNRRVRNSDPPRERRALPDPGPPQGQLRDGSGSEPLASHRRYRSEHATPGRDESRLGHNPVSTLSNSDTSPTHPRSRHDRRHPAAPPQSTSHHPASASNSAASNSSHSVTEPGRRARTHARFRYRWTSDSQVKPIPPYT